MKKDVHTLILKWRYIHMKNFLKKFISDNLGKIIVFLSIFLLSSICGIIYFKYIDIYSKNYLTTYMNDINTKLLNNEYTINNMQIIYLTIINIFKNILIIYILGCSVIFAKLNYIFFAYKGFSIGISVSSVIYLLGRLKGTIYSLLAIFLPNILIILVFILLSVLWINFSNMIIKNKSLYKLKEYIYRNTVITLITMFLIILCIIPIQLLSVNCIYNFLKII
ncbi:MAG: hypothetical protein E7311_00445 [Clostridiales bacterium]|nr:hypothetical protein [Clostridiales bacterium]